MFRRLQQFGLKVKLEKCQFFKESVDYLGHTISLQGLAPTEERVASIVQAPVPRNTVELKSFLGLMTYNCHFLPFLSQVLHPLYQLVKREATWKWGLEQTRAFQTAKDPVAKASVLAQYDVDKPIRLYCDASPRGVGVCLMHVINGQERPVAYASRTLAPAELNYAQIEQEALAIVFAIRKFHQYLYGRQFTLITDHRPLCKLLGSNQGVSSLAAARMQRWALILSTYQYVLEYTPGSQNECADCLSRLPLSASQHDPAEHHRIVYGINRCT